MFTVNLRLTSTLMLSTEKETHRRQAKKRRSEEGDPHMLFNNSSYHTKPPSNKCLILTMHQKLELSDNTDKSQ